MQHRLRGRAPESVPRLETRSRGRQGNTGQSPKVRGTPKPQARPEQGTRCARSSATSSQHRRDRTAQEAEHGVGSRGPRQVGLRKGPPQQHKPRKGQASATPAAAPPRGVRKQEARQGINRPARAANLGHEPPAQSPRGERELVEAAKPQPPCRPPHRRRRARLTSQAHAAPQHSWAGLLLAAEPSRTGQRRLRRPPR